MEGFSSQRIALTVDVLQDRKICYLQARPCIFQPGNFTGWGNDGVKAKLFANTLSWHDQSSISKDYYIYKSLQLAIQPVIKGQGVTLRARPGTLSVNSAILL